MRSDAFPRATRRLTALLAAGLVVLPTRAGAQVASEGSDAGRRVRLLARVDAFLARSDAIHVGAGGTVDLGSYVRLDGVIAAGGARSGDEEVASGRAELLARFLLDPFRQARWGIYGGAGLIARHDDGPAGTSGYLTLIAGAELPGGGTTRPAIEIGIGGGARLALTIRQGRPNRR